MTAWDVASWAAVAFLTLALGVLADYCRRRDRELRADVAAMRAGQRLLDSRFAEMSAALRQSNDGRLRALESTLLPPAQTTGGSPWTTP